MEICPDCKKAYLMYDPQLETAVCTNKPEDCDYRERMERAKYIDKYVDEVMFNKSNNKAYFKIKSSI